jgi:hypothetical protein
MASGHVNRIYGRTHGCTDQACDVKISLANPEPSTHGHKVDGPKASPDVRFRGDSVAKVENRTTLKISRKPIFRRFYRRNAR